MTTKYGELNPGDLIGVAYNNYIWPAIFFKEGSKKNANFGLVIHILFSKNSGTKKLYSNHINRTDRNNSAPIVKISSGDLNEQDRKDYLEALNYLTEIGKI